MNKNHLFMILNIFLIAGFILTLPELVTAIKQSDYLALNILFGLAFIGINFFDLTILKWRRENGNRNKS